MIIFCMGLHYDFLKSHIVRISLYSTVCLFLYFCLSVSMCLCLCPSVSFCLNEAFISSYMTTIIQSCLRENISDFVMKKRRNDKMTKKEQGQIHDYPSRIRVGRSSGGEGHWSISIGAVGSNSSKTLKK